MSLSPSKRAKTSNNAPDNVQHMKRLAVHKFVELFRTHPSVATFAPGRVNLVGEHTDYSEGFVLPVAIPLGVVCVAALSPSTDRIVRAFSLQRAEDGVVQFEIGEKSASPWGVFLSGVAALHPGALKYGVQVVLSSDVPLGGGLSSSAALDVAFAMALEALDDAQKRWDAVERALRCVEADHQFPGVPCGIMDQYISSCAVPRTALLIDCRDKSSVRVPFDDESLAVVVANTNVAHSHASGEYKSLVRHCREASALLHVPFLRDVSDVARVEKEILDDAVRKRARHVVTECARTLQAKDAALARDWHAFGKIMNQSHASLRDDFQVSCPELDTLVDIAQRHAGVKGARMTGGGFGGCIVALVEREHAAGLVRALLEGYPRKCPGKQATCHVFEGASGGARLLAL
jgi:galactokinase